MKLKILKSYIKINLAYSFIKLPKFSANSTVYLNKKLNKIFYYILVIKIFIILP